MTAKWQYKQAYEAALVTARELRSENAKLREGYDSLAQEHVQTIVELSNAYREEDRLKAENAKLRELVRSVLVLRHDAVYKWLDATTAEVCGKSFTEQACELGIEAEG